MAQPPVFQLASHLQRLLTATPQIYATESAVRFEPLPSNPKPPSHPRPKTPTSHRLIQTFDLLEKILLLLLPLPLTDTSLQLYWQTHTLTRPLKTLLHAQRVSKVFLFTIQTSPGLQRALWFKTPRDCACTKNPILMTSHRGPFSEGRLSLSKIFTPRSSFPMAGEEGKAIFRITLPQSELSRLLDPLGQESWRGMKFVCTAEGNFRVRVLVQKSFPKGREWGVGWQEDLLAVVQGDNDMTMRELVKKVRERMEMEGMGDIVGA